MLMASTAMRPITPMRLLRIPEAFDHEQFVFEPKIDGFRSAHSRPSLRTDLA